MTNCVRCLKLLSTPSDFRTVKLTLEVQYPRQYPDVLPELSLYAIEGEGEIEDSEINDLLKDLLAVARAFFPCSH